MKRIEVYQNGRKLVETSITEESFDQITTFNDILCCFNNKANYENAVLLISKHLITTVLLVEPDRDGHPEVLRGLGVVPDYTPNERELIRQGYMLAMKEVKEKCLSQAEDKEKITNLQHIYRNFVEITAFGDDLKLDNITI